MSLDAESYLSGIYQTNVIDFNGYALTFRDGFCNQVSSGRGPLCVNFTSVFAVVLIIPF